jgi:hypothetical protein
VDPLNESERSAYEALLLFLIRARLEDDFSRGTIFSGEARVEQYGVSFTSFISLQIAAI